MWTCICWSNELKLQALQLTTSYAVFINQTIMQGDLHYTCYSLNCLYMWTNRLFVRFFHLAYQVVQWIFTEYSIVGTRVGSIPVNASFVLAGIHISIHASYTNTSKHTLQRNAMPFDHNKRALLYIKTWHLYQTKSWWLCVSFSNNLPAA